MKIPNNNLSFVVAKNSVTDPWHKSRQHCSITQLLNRIVSTLPRLTKK